MQGEWFKVLTKYWGYTSFRQGQEAVVASIVNGRNVLALFPTGAGKSICYQIPAMLKTGCALVISPLVSLMKDQVDQLKDRDIPAISIHSGLTWSEMKVIMENALKGRYKLIYVSPERLVSDNFREFLPNLNITLLVVDEAHCISQWGHDFRPSYLKISEVVPMLSNATIAAFTASAPPKVQADIVQHLFPDKPEIHESDFTRSNLNFHVIETENKTGYLLKLLQRFQGNTLIFCDTRREAEETSRFLTASNHPCDYYHAGLAKEVRSRKQDNWMKGLTKVIACTNAFGMGVDKDNVRMVVHLSPPQSPEAYYQEAGRAGRDGLKSWCILLYRPHETKILKERIVESFPSPSDLELVYNAVFNYFGIAAGAGTGLTAEFDLGAISSRYKLRQLLVLHAASNIELLGFWTITESLYSPSKVQFLWKYEDVYEFKIKNESYEALLDVLLRSYGGIFEYHVKINEKTIAKRLNSKVEEVEKKLNALSKLGLLHYFHQTDKPLITFLESRSPYPEFKIKKLEPLRKNKLLSVENMEKYMSTNACRSVFWVQYFTEKKAKQCGHCDNCIKAKRKFLGSKEFDECVSKIKSILGNQGKSRADTLEAVGSDFELRETLRWLLDHKKILLNANHQYYWNE